MSRHSNGRAAMLASSAVVALSLASGASASESNGGDKFAISSATNSQGLADFGVQRKQSASDTAVDKAVVVAQAQQPAAPSQQRSAVAATQETVIVTGTRVVGMTAADSAAPITVLGSDALAHGTGSSDLRQQLGQTIPSFTAQQFSGDTSNLTLSAALRGLSPNDTLILVNGHRRHYSGDLHVNAGNFASGSSPADLSLIPSAAIDHVEVLLQGAAAQYGTDAISGVVNIILKKKSSGGVFSATAGDYYNRGGSSAGIGNTGEKYDISYNMGLPLFDKGFINFTVEKEFQNFTQYAGAEARYLNAQGMAVPQSGVTSVGANGVANLSTVGNGVPNTLLPFVQGYPRADRAYANPQYQLTSAELNAGYDFNDDFSLYSFGTIGHKFGKSNQLLRLPNQIITTTGSNQPCSATNLNGYATAVTSNGVTPACAIGVGGGAAALGASGLNAQGQVISSGNAGNLFSSTLINVKNGSLLPSATGEPSLGTTPELVFAPGGFQPYEVLKEDDYQYNAGAKLNVAGWEVDADVGYGKDIDSIYTWNSANRSLFIDTHTTPTNFYDGNFTASQFTGTIDATHSFNVGMASPLTVAIGVEAREDTYRIGSGDPLSYYKEGAQAFPGFPTAGAINRSRKNYAGYIDLALAPIEELQIDVAGRAEHYTDFGDTQIGKITARYDFNPKIAVRGTISTGFRAPTLAEEFYTAVNVSPTSATLQLPADSAAANLLGLSNLKPEISTSYSAGIVAHPLEDLSFTIDAYSIAIGNRIVTSSTVTASGGAINTPLVTSAIALRGVSLDPTASQQGVTSFLNGISSLTQGVDVTVNYPTDFDDFGLVSWTLAGNYNYTGVESVNAPPAVLLASNPNAFFFNSFSVFGFEHATPTTKIGLTADWSLDQWGATVRETYYGPQHGFVSPNAGGEEIVANQADIGLTDLELRYNVTEQLQFSFGANNLFNMHPDTIGLAPSVCPSPPAVTLVSGGSCKLGPNQVNGETQNAGNGVVNNQPLGTPFDPNGGYYYGRVSFNF